MPTGGHDAKVLIVVPCLDEEANLPRLLDSLLHEADGATVVVVDGGSKDRSRAIVTALARRHPNLFLLNNPKRIQSAAVNLAARRYGAGHRWLVRIDAHAAYPAGYVQLLGNAAMRTGATSVVVPMATQGHGCFQKAAAAAQNSVLGTGGALHRHPGRGAWVDHGHHALFDLNLFMRAGGYDENFAANEDSELDRRLLAAGGTIWLEPAAAITYFPRRTPGALFRQYRNYGKGRARNLKRHPAPVKLRQMLPLGVVPAIAAALGGMVLAPVQATALLLVLPMACWLLASLVAGVGLGCRAQSWCGAGAGLAAAIMHAGWSLGFILEALDRRPMPSAPVPLTFEPGQIVPARHNPALAVA